MYLPQPTADFELVSPGTYLAFCYRVIDLGTQKQIDTFHGNREVERRKIMLAWELDELMKDGRPFSMQRRYTWSMGDKATLRKDLEGWRGVPFKETDFGRGGFNIKNVLAKPCMLSVVHSVAGDRTYSNIASVSSVPKQMKPISDAYRLVNEPIYMWLDPDLWSDEVFQTLSPALQTTISKSPEYTMCTSMPMAPEYSVDGQPIRGDMDDDIPF